MGEARYFVKKDAQGEVHAFGRGGAEGELIEREEFERLRLVLLSCVQRELRQEEEAGHSQIERRKGMK